MRTIILVLILTAGVFALMGLLNSAAFSGDSSSKNLQDYARMEAKKAEFYRAEKNRLVKEMVELWLELKQYKVDLFLNSKFQEWNGHRN
jgi:hypothetical protein